MRLLKENLEQYGWKVVSTWAMGDELETLQRSAEADVQPGSICRGTARSERCSGKHSKCPYVIGTPNQWLAEDISNALEQGSYAADSQSQTDGIICRTACSRMQTLH